MVATEMLAPVGPYHAAKCSGLDHMRQMISGGAAKVRSSIKVLVTVMVGHCLRPFLVAVEIAGGRCPSGPGGDFLEWCRVQAARSVLAC